MLCKYDIISLSDEEENTFLYQRYLDKLLKGLASKLNEHTHDLGKAVQESFFKDIQITPGYHEVCFNGERIEEINWTQLSTTTVPQLNTIFVGDITIVELLLTNAVHL